MAITVPTMTDDPEALLARCRRCGHPELDHTLVGQRACEVGVGCERRCDCKAYDAPGELVRNRERK